MFPMFFCLYTKERKSQDSIEAVRRNFLNGRYTKQL